MSAMRRKATPSSSSTSSTSPSSSSSRVRFALPRPLQRPASTATFLLLLTAAAITLHLPAAQAFTFNVVPDDGSLPPFSSIITTNSNNASSTASAITTLQDALDNAVGGDVIVLANGTYSDRVKSTVGGEEGKPITVVGGRDAVIKGNSPSIWIAHSWITLQGFTVDGEHGSTHERESFVNKCIQVLGPGVNETEAVVGFVMENMLVQNCGEECVRLKNFVVNSTIIGNTIQHCGLYDFEFADNTTTGKTGEGIYIGTSWKQWEDYGEDRCNGNWVSGNTIATYGNECVEVKEGSSGNVIENNVCAHQLDVESGCFCSRGDANTFRFNNMSDCDGSGVRLGGWEGYGHDNDVYDNVVVNALNGAIGVHVMPQGSICHNACEDGLCGITGGENFEDIQATWDQACANTTYDYEDRYGPGQDNDTSSAGVEFDDDLTQNYDDTAVVEFDDDAVGSANVVAYVGEEAEDGGGEEEEEDDDDDDDDEDDDDDDDDEDDDADDDDDDDEDDDDDDDDDN